MKRIATVFDMDFYEYTKYSAIRRARFLSLL